MSQVFKCPNCGAPVEYDGGDTVAVRCEYCGTSAPVPQDLRPEATHPVALSLQQQATQLSNVMRLVRSGQLDQAARLFQASFGVDDAVARAAVQKLAAGRYVEVGAMSVQSPSVAQVSFADTPVTKPARRNGCLVGALVLAAIMCVVPAFIAIIVASVSPQTFAPAIDVNSTAQSILANLTEQPIAPPTEAPTLASPPTPGYASIALTFGSTGTGVGHFNDARSIGVDGAGNVYVGEYAGGRIQVFDSSGTFINQWFAGTSKTLLLGFAVDRKGVVYVADGANITRYDGSTGKMLGKLQYTGGPGFGELAIAPDGGLAAMWYQRREGIFTSTDGAREDLVRFDAQGQVTQVIKGVISSQTEDLSLNNVPVLDGRGNLYVLSTMSAAVFSFTPAGKFVTRFGSAGSDPGQFVSPNTMAVDSQGRLYLGEAQRIQVFSADGRYLNVIPTKGVVFGMAFDAKDELFVVARDTVVKLVLNER